MVNYSLRSCVVLPFLEKWIAHCLIAPELKTGKLGDIIILEDVINDLLQKSRSIKNNSIYFKCNFLKRLKDAILIVGISKKIAKSYLFCIISCVSNKNRSQIKIMDSTKWV